ncbi:MAG: VOC family protein [Actinomycetes bacterium]
MIPNGLHHITCVTVDAAECVRFYTRLLGLKLIKRTVNQDVPDVWHLFFGDDRGSAGADLTFFEFRGLPRGIPGAGAAHTIRWRVAGPESLEFWERRLGEAGVATSLDSGSLSFSDPEGLGHELVAGPWTEEPLTASSAEIPPEHALQGFDGVRIHSHDPEGEARWLREAMNLSGEGSTAKAEGPSRSATVIYEQAPPSHHQQGAGSIHHIAWTAFGGNGEMEDWRLKLARSGVRPTPIIDRFWFNAVYFRAPGGLLHEFSTPEPGFTIDEPLETLGTKLVLPPKFEPYREQIVQRLTPID